ncbi:phasin family protein [Microvirga sp. TS319]|uniref:phasin family protein n=1 Tax=Microvirga sp. TS319 TaxID=3241165 RepID=UPI00351AA823
MSATQRFSQAPPDRANELFEKLLATSDSAIKTRERLFASLKEELELLASLQEEYLFPVLRQHGMQELAREANNDNEQTSALLGDLDTMPKNSTEFLAKVGELRRIFQQHIRDDRKELLPAVLKVLSNEEVEAVVEKVEDDMASIDEAKRAEARRSREQVATVQRVTEDVADTLRASVESAQTLAQALQEAMETGFGALSELTRHSTGHGLVLAGHHDNGALGLSEDAAHNLRAVAQSSTALARGLQEVSREVVDRSQKRLQRNLDGLQVLARSRTMTDFVEAHTTLLRDNLEQTMENSRRIAEITIQMAEEATRVVTMQAEKTAERVGRAA